MKARCRHCRALREIVYPVSTLDGNTFIISGKCELCGGYLEQKRRVVLA